MFQAGETFQGGPHGQGERREDPGAAPDTAIAIVGLSCRYAGARTPGDYWTNLRSGIDSIATYTDEQLLAAGVDPAILAMPDYVRVGAPIEDMECFDAGLFGLSPREAAIMDPQHRHFLECTWEALEDAGHTPARFGGAIGVFGGSGHNAYLPSNLLTNPKLVRDVGLFLLRHTGNDKDFLTSRVSYLLDLKGPSVNVQTACSTSLVAVHMAAQSLLAGECDMAIAGGASIELPHARGYLHEEGGILSPDGKCRPFDADAQGTVFGSGVGLVVLRRLADAVADGDHVYAVIRGSAINNDGAGKVGYLAPSLDGHAQVVTEALAVAEVDAATIDYVEAHGTGTPVGDPIEVAALTQAFRRDTDQVGYCALGSVKANIGHTDTAAGTAGLIKVALALHHRELPPTLNHAAPNPLCELDRSPFVISSTLKPWPRRDHAPRRAGISSLGVGGTNAHVVVEEAPSGMVGSAARAHQLFAISAGSATALAANAIALADHLSLHPEIDVGDAAYTLSIGRQALTHRQIVVADTVAAAASALATPDRANAAEAIDDRPVSFLFCGAGSQHAGMGAGLYESEPVFREVIDACIEQASVNGVQLRRWMLPNVADADRAAIEMERPSIALPALFAVQVALARLWMSWGVRPAALIGHSAGEYSAAHLAGVIDLPDAMRVLVTRARLFESLPPGSMLSVPLSEAALRPMLGQNLSIAAINGTSLCVVSGPVAAIERLQCELGAREIESHRVRIEVAAHSTMLDPVLDRFRDCMTSVRLSVPTLPFVSNLTGTWITPAQASDPDYWVRHLRETVRFTNGLERLLETPHQVLLEVGPGRTMSSLARQHPARTATQPVLNAMRYPTESIGDMAHLLTTLGRLWTLGVSVDWDAFWASQTRMRVSLPTYRFDRQRHWIDPGAQMSSPDSAEDEPERRAAVADWFYAPVWRRAPLPEAGAARGAALIFEDGEGIGAAIATRLRAQGQQVVTVRSGWRFARTGRDTFTLPPGAASGYAKLIACLADEGRMPTQIHHCWLVTGHAVGAARAQDLGFYSVLSLVQALSDAEAGDADTGAVRITAISNGLQRVADDHALCPAKATVLGACRTADAEYPNLSVGSVDIVVPSTATGRLRLADMLIDEGGTADQPAAIAYRSGERWIQSFEPTPRPDIAHAASGGLRARGTYLVTGGLGGLGLAIALDLARSLGARIALMARTRLPARDAWGDTLAAGTIDDPVCAIIRQLLAIEAAGGEVLLIGADVTDVGAVRRAVRDTRRRFGRIDGIFHAAGVLDDGVMQLKTRAAAAAVIAPKLFGTLALEAALADDPPDFMLLFSSISAFAGLAGQADYAAANAFLDAHAQSRRDDERTRVISVGWSQWRDVGMAAALSPVVKRPPTPIGPGRSMDHPFLETFHDLANEGIVVDARLGADTHWLLDEHRLAEGSALIPGTGFLEIARAVHAEIARGPAIMSDVAFLTPFATAKGTSRDLRIHLSRDTAVADRRSDVKTDLAWRFAIYGRPTEHPDADWTEHAHGSIAPDREDAPKALRLDSIRSRCATSMIARPTASPYLDFGPRWQVIEKGRCGIGEALLTLTLPVPFLADLDTIALHPALLDMASAGAQVLIPGYDPARDFFAPMSWAKLRMLAPLPAHIVAHIRHRPSSDGSALAAFDVTVTDVEGAVVADVAGFTMIRVRNPSLLASPARHSPRSATRALGADPSFALLPAEGMTAIRLILGGAPAAHLIVSPGNLYPALARLRAPRSAVKTAAPADDADAPRNATERLIASLWCDMLGLDRVGRSQDFFDLGGHSLLAVQFTNRLRKRTGTTLPLAALLQSPTVAGLSALIDPEGAASVILGAPRPGVPDADVHSLAIPVAPAASQDLITIRAGGSRPALFIVHDGLGETLLYRSLAHRLSPEHAIYGIEPLRRGDGSFAHTGLAEMAADYVARIRRRQPDGPYLLAGLCAGGVIAFEMARQLQDEGAVTALVAILDAADTEADHQRFHILAARWKRIRHLVHQADSTSPLALATAVPLLCSKAAHAVSWEITSRIEHRRHAHAVARLRILPNASVADDAAPPLAFIQLYQVAHRAHRPAGLFEGGHVILFKAMMGNGDDEDEPFGDVYADRLLGWGKRVVDDVELVPTPGGHVSLLREPHVDFVAERLQVAIDAALLASRATSDGKDPRDADRSIAASVTPILTLASSR